MDTKFKVDSLNMMEHLNKAYLISTGSSPLKTLDHSLKKKGTFDFSYPKFDNETELTRSRESVEFKEENIVITEESETDPKDKKQSKSMKPLKSAIKLT